METIFFYALLSVLIISLASFIGIFTIGIKTDKLRSFLIYIISFSAGALLGDAFLHLLPEIAGEFSILSSVYILLGIFVFFILEKVMHWRHCHLPITEKHIHHFAYMNLFGDSLHNFLDGLIISASYIVSLPVGLATSVAVLFHEIPQEVGDFGVLIYGGFTRIRALFLNFAISLTAILGCIVGFVLKKTSRIELLLIPLAIGGFIYIACTDLIPELHRECRIDKSLGQIIAFLLGVGAMFLLIFLG